MPKFRVSVIDRSFVSHNDHEAPSIAAAGKEGICSALAIGAAEVAKGKTLFGAEVRVEKADRLVGRFMVSVGVMALRGDTGGSK